MHGVAWSTVYQVASVRKVNIINSARPNETNAEMYWSRPYIIIGKRNCITVIELTYCFETNLPKSHDYDTTKYQSLCSALLNFCSHFNWYFLRLPLNFIRYPIKNIWKLLKWKNRVFCKNHQKVSRSGNTCFIPIFTELISYIENSFNIKIYLFFSWLVVNFYKLYVFS